MVWCELTPAHSRVDSLPMASLGSGAGDNSPLERAAVLVCVQVEFWATSHRVFVQDGISAFVAGYWKVLSI